MASTAAAVTRRGAGRPGTSAVVITTSKPLIAFSSAFCCCARSSSVSSRAYPPSPATHRCRRQATAPPPSGPGRPPPDARRSRWCARPGAWPSPAPEARPHPTPSTSTVAGFTVPAAVVSIGKNRVDSDAASSTALYPATLACDDSASITCAREIRGMASSANACTPASVQRADRVVGIARRQEADQRLPAAQPGDLVCGRRCDLDHDVGGPGIPDGGARPRCRARRAATRLRPRRTRPPPPNRY